MADIFSGQFYPNGLNHNKAISKDTLWLQITPKKLDQLDPNRRINAISTSNADEDTMWFLMPMEFLFSIQHTWEELTTPASALREITSKLKTQGQVARGTVGMDGVMEGNKADNPHLYSNTNRREFNIALEFSVYNDAYNDVFRPVQTLIEQSCPEISDKFTEFTFPYVFSLQTYTGDMKSVDIISIESVAITTIQPSYKGPWIDGYPSYASLDIGFVDLKPLYRSTLLSDKNSKITTRSKTTNRR